MEKLLKFMQREEPNGLWLEWLEEIREGESSFDPDYVITVLLNWYNDSKEEKYLKWITHVNGLTVKDKGVKLTDRLIYNNIAFYLTAITETNRVYKSLDEMNPMTILTATYDYDGALIGTIDEQLREDDNDDMIRYFDSLTGDEE